MEIRIISLKIAEFNIAT